ncbi:MAG: hypothetical protein DRH15_09030 [Deltaproteobacteria bacterium]|nr:MAG: hypothetical protein DRH15_09030 [Deltaproteobacteria bacterium]
MRQDSLFNPEPKTQNQEPVDCLTLLSPFSLLLSPYSFSLPSFLASWLVSDSFFDRICQTPMI